MEPAEGIETPAATISVNIPANTPRNPTHIPANTPVHNPVQDLQPMAHRVAGAVAQAFLEQGVSLNVALAYIPRQWWNMNSATIHINYMTPTAALHPSERPLLRQRRGEEGQTQGHESHRSHRRHTPCGHRDGRHHSGTHGFELLGWDIGCHDHNHDNHDHRGHTQAEASQVRASFATQLRHSNSDSYSPLCFGLALCRRRIGETRE